MLVAVRVERGPDTADALLRVAANLVCAEVGESVYVAGRAEAWPGNRARIHGKARPVGRPAIGLFQAVTRIAFTVVALKARAGRRARIWAHARKLRRIGRAGRRVWTWRRRARARARPWQALDPRVATANHHDIAVGVPPSIAILARHRWVSTRRTCLGNRIRALRAPVRIHLRISGIAPLAPVGVHPSIRTVHSNVADGTVALVRGIGGAAITCRPGDAAPATAGQGRQ